MQDYEVYVGFDPGTSEHSSGHPLNNPKFRWPQGVLPRWRQMDTSRCVAALLPETGGGVIRYLEGTRDREEVALVILEIGDSAQPIYLSGVIVSGVRLPEGVMPRLVPDLSAADKDLAIRVKQRLPTLPWYHLQQMGQIANGKLVPLLIDDLGKPIAAVWIAHTTEDRWYLLPVGLDWENVVDWLITKAIPTYVPTAVYRATPINAIPDNLLTPAELGAKSALDELERATELRRNGLLHELELAEEEASRIRSPLLFGQSDDLKKAVASVLEKSGFDVEDLDKTFEGSVSGDLLASRDGSHWLIEVTAASKAPKEREWMNLRGHLAIWPTLRPEQLVGGVLIINAYHSFPPSERPPPYGRPEFLRALDVPVISTVALYSWWRDGDLARISRAVTGPAKQYSHVQASDVRLVDEGASGLRPKNRPNPAS